MSLKQNDDFVETQIQLWEVSIANKDGCAEEGMHHALTTLIKGGYTGEAQALVDNNGDIPLEVMQRVVPPQLELSQEENVDVHAELRELV